MRASRAGGDTGDADPAVESALAAYAAGRAAEQAVLTAVAASRLLVPVVAVLTEAGEDGAEKETEMALPTLIGHDGRKAVIAFTGVATVRRWRADARPVPVTAARLWPAVAAEQADAVVIDVAGPVPLVIEGARLTALAAGQSPPPPHADPDVRGLVAAALADLTAAAPPASSTPPSPGAPPAVPSPSLASLPGFTLSPGGPDADLTVTLATADPGVARAAGQLIAARLAPRLRRGIAIRLVSETCTDLWLKSRPVCGDFSSQ